ncbi:MAG TPA: DUF3618 domain-containing protein [Micrococcaceae bacterium]|jgi:gas vesicle protein|nr:DUF3618 domain-containing protein [Micrococcaceae bacterium]
MSQSPEEIRAEIDRTRGRLGTDVDALADKVSPSSIAHRQTEKVRGTFGRMRSSVMGSADDATDTARHAAQQAGEAVQDMPDAVTRKTQGSPLAAGLIAFGAGWLLSALIPASDTEKEAASTVKEKAQPLIQNAGEMAKNVANDMKEPAQEAMDQVRRAAQDSAQTVKEEGTSAAQDVKERTQDAKERVQSSSQSPDGGQPSDGGYRI